MFSKTVYLSEQYEFWSSSELSEFSEQTEDSDSDEKEARFRRRMNLSTDRDSLKMHGIKYFECLQATSLWLIELEL